MTINLATNPSFETLTIADYSNNDLIGQVYVDQVDTTRREHVLITPAKAEGNDQVVRYTFVKDLEKNDTTMLCPLDVTLTQNTTYTMQLTLRARRPLATVALQINGQRGGDFALGTEWTQLTTTITTSGSSPIAPPVYTGVAVPATSINPTNGNEPNYVEIKWVCFVEGEYSQPYFDGSLPNAEWTGEPHKSTSVLTASPQTVTGADGIVRWSVGQPQPKLDHTTIRNVKKFGAVGDGVTDDTEALARALDVGSEFTVLHFPPGRYRITSQITWDPYRVELRGQRASIFCDLHADPANDDALDNDDSTYAIRVVSSAPFPFGSPWPNRINQHSGIEFYTVNHQCNGLLISGTPGASAGAASQKSAHFTLSNMIFRGFYVAHSIASYAYMLGFRDCVFTSNRTSALLHKDGANGETYEDRGERIYYDGCDFLNNFDTDGWTLDMEGDQEFKFFNCSFDWSVKLLRAGLASKIEFVGCHLETPGATFKTHAATFGVVSPYILQEQDSVVSFANSLIFLNYKGTPSEADNKRDWLFDIHQWATMNMHSTYLTIDNVTALTKGAGRINMVSPRSYTTAVPPMLSLTSKHNLLDRGVAESFRTEGTWTALRGTVDSVSHDSREAALLKNSEGGWAQLRITVPVPGTFRYVGVRTNIRAGANASIKITQFLVEMLDRTGKVIGSRGMDSAQLPSLVPDNTWTLLSLASYIDNEEWNPDVVASLRVVLATDQTQSNLSLYTSDVVINAY